MAGTDERECVFRQACHLCGKEVHGELIAAGTDAAIAQEDLTGYRCTSCGVAYCQNCGITKVFRIFGRSVCKSCGAAARQADYVVERKPALMELFGYVEEVEAGEYGGAVRDEPALLSLFPDSVRVTKQSGAAGPRMSTKVTLDEVAEVAVRPPSREGKRGSLVIRPNKRGILGRLLACTHEIRFDAGEQSAFEQFAARLRETAARGAEPAPNAARPPAAPAQVPAPDQVKPKGSGLSDLELLEKLADLHKKGIVTDGEFTAKKKQILGR